MFVVTRLRGGGLEIWLFIDMRPCCCVYGSSGMVWDLCCVRDGGVKTGMGWGVGAVRTGGGRVM